MARGRGPIGFLTMGAIMITTYILQRSARAAFVKGISDVDWLDDAWRIFIEDYEGASQ
jgi:hypothetical protein